MITIQPTVYDLVLNCGHIQLAAHSVHVGSSYPCWTACDSAHPVEREVVAVNYHTHKDNESFVVTSALNNAEMLHVQKIVDEMNQKF